MPIDIDVTDHSFGHLNQKQAQYINIVNKLFAKQLTPILSQLSVVLYKGTKDALVTQPN